MGGDPETLLASPQRRKPATTRKARKETSPTKQALAQRKRQFESKQQQARSSGKEELQVEETKERRELLLKQVSSMRHILDLSDEGVEQTEQTTIKQAEVDVTTHAESTKAGIGESKKKTKSTSKTKSNDSSSKLKKKKSKGSSKNEQIARREKLHTQFTSIRHMLDGSDFLMEEKASAAPVSPIKAKASSAVDNIRKNHIRTMSPVKSRGTNTSTEEKKKEHSIRDLFKRRIQTSFRDLAKKNTDQEKLKQQQTAMETCSEEDEMEDMMVVDDVDFDDDENIAWGSPKNTVVPSTTVKVKTDFPEMPHFGESFNSILDPFDDDTTAKEPSATEQKEDKAPNTTPHHEDEETETTTSSSMCSATSKNSNHNNNTKSPVNKKKMGRSKSHEIESANSGMEKKPRRQRRSSLSHAPTLGSTSIGMDLPSGGEPRRTAKRRSSLEVSSTSLDLAELEQKPAVPKNRHSSLSMIANSNGSGIDFAAVSKSLHNPRTDGNHARRGRRSSIAGSSAAAAAMEKVRKMDTEIKEGNNNKARRRRRASIVGGGSGGVSSSYGMDHIASPRRVGRRSSIGNPIMMHINPIDSPLRKHKTKGPAKETTELGTITKKNAGKSMDGSFATLTMSPNISNIRKRRTSIV